MAHLASARNAAAEAIYIFIEQLQPEWLVQRTQRRLYDTGKGVALGLVAGLLAGLSNGLSVIVDYRQGSVIERVTVSLGAIGLAMLIAAVSGMLIGGIVKSNKLRSANMAITPKRYRPGTTVGVASGVATGYVWGLISGLLVGPVIGFVIGLITGLIVKTDTIVVVEALKW